MDPEFETCNSDEYFKQISYFVSLQDIYEVLDTCYYSDDMQLRTIAKDSDQRPMKLWAICFRYLVYSVDNDEFVYVIDLEDNNKTLKIKNFPADMKANHFSYNGGYLYAFSEKEIAILHCNKDFSDDGTVIDAHESKVRTIKTTLKILGAPMSKYQFKDKYQQNFNDDDSFSYSYEQLREVIPREKINDPVVKFCNIYSKAFSFAMALRRSGNVDLYWNMQNKYSSEGQDIQDIEMSLGAYFFEMADGTIKTFRHMGSNKLTLDNAVVLDEKNVEFKQLFLKRLLNNVKLFTGFHIVMIRSVTMAVITHGCFVSIYDINNSKWLNHVQFEDDIVLLFRHYKTKDDRYQTILCKNGATYIGILEYDEFKEPVPQKHRNLSVAGTVLRWGEDIENNQTLYLVVKQNNALTLKYLFRGKVQKVDVDGLENLQDNINITCFQNRGESTYVLIHNVREFTNFLKTEGHIHSACAYDITKNFFLFDQVNMYMVTIPTFGEPTYKSFPGVYCSGIQTITKNFNYALCRETSESKYQGLRFFDMESISSKEQCQLTKLKHIDVGQLGYFEKGTTVMRFGFLNGLHSLVVSPILHRNMNRLMGANNLDDYWCFRVIKDKVIALKKTGLLQTWNLYTGKFEGAVQLDIVEWGKFEIFTKTKEDRVIIISKDEVEGEKAEDHFLDWQLTPNIENFSVKADYVHPHYKNFQRMYINNTYDRMVVILINYRAYFYQRVQIDDQNPEKIRWKYIRQIVDFPNDLDTGTKFLEQFTPCLQRYLFLDKNNHQFVVKGNYNGQELQRIPKHIVTVEENCANPNHYTNRMKWLSTSRLLIANEEGIEVVYDFDDNFKEISTNVRPLFNEIEGEEWKSVIYYKDRSTPSQDELLKRIKKLYQDYKSAYYLYQDKDERLMKLNEVMYNVDKWYFHHNEQTFSFVHWSLMEQIRDGKLQINTLEMDLIETLIYTITPGGQTFLHYLASQKEQLIELFQKTHTEDAIKIHIPFLQNFRGYSLFHTLANNEDFRSISQILNFLKLYGIDHHSRAIETTYPLLLEYEVQGLTDYLDSRVVQTKELQKIDRGSMKDDYPEIMVSSVKMNQDEVEKQIFTNEHSIITSIKLQFLDLPGFYHYLDDGFKDFFEQLASIDNFAFFSNKAIRKLIDFNYPLVQKYITYKIVIPFIVFHMSFVFYMNLIYEYRDTNAFYIAAHWIFSVILAVFAFYFLLNELNQFKAQGIVYIASIWNYIDLIAPLGILALHSLMLIEMLDIQMNIHVIRTILAVSTFFMWLKLLYVMRIFKATGYLIRMIIDVIADMGIFLLLLTITVLAFGDSLLTLSMGNATEDTRFVGANFIDASLYSYRLVLGDFDTGNFGEISVPLVWMFFLFSTIFNLIVMLNLLVAIISDSYARIQNDADNAAYQEMAKLIDENQYLIPIEIRQSYAQKDQYLIVVTNLDKDEDQSGDPVIDRIQSIQREVTAMTEQIEDINANSDKVKNLNSYVDSIKEGLEKTTGDQQKVIQDANTANDAYQKLSDSVASFKYDIEEAKCLIHCHELSKIQVGLMKKMIKDYSTGFVCDNANFTGCKSEMTSESTDFRTDEEEELYHCFKTNFNYCAKCYEAYGNKAYKYSLTKVKFSQISSLQGYEKGWLCDARYFQGCSRGKETERDNSAFCYHCYGCNFDLCENCFNSLRA